MSIRMNTEAKAYYRKVRDQATTLGLRTHLARALRRVDYPEYFGAPVYVELWPDFAPMSFTFDIKDRNTHRRYMSGGLIYEGPDAPADGSAPSFTVSVDAGRVGWFIHT